MGARRSDYLPVVLRHGSRRRRKRGDRARPRRFVPLRRGFFRLTDQFVRAVPVGRRARGIEARLAASRAVTSCSAFAAAGRFRPILISAGNASAAPWATASSAVVAVRLHRRERAGAALAQAAVRAEAPAFGTARAPPAPRGSEVGRTAVGRFGRARFAVRFREEPERRFRRRFAPKRSFGMGSGSGGFLSSLPAEVPMRSMFCVSATMEHARSTFLTRARYLLSTGNLLCLLVSYRPLARDQRSLCNTVSYKQVANKKAGERTMRFIGSEFTGTGVTAGQLSQADT